MAAEQEPLRILSVVTLVSPQGEFGGPVRVAVNQAKALRARGHEVTVLAASRGYDGAPPEQIEGGPARLFPARTALPRTGFAGLTSPGLLRWLRTHVREYDVVHVHAARDLVTLPAARIAARRGVRLVLQTHGMIDPSSNPLARPLDAVLTRPLLRRAAHVLALTEREHADLREVAGPGLEPVMLENGTEVPEPPARGDDPPTMLYLARLAPRKRPVMFVELAAQLAPEHPQWHFSLVGPDEGEGDAVRRAVERARAEGVEVSWHGPVAPEETLEVMRGASLYVLPAVDEPFPMAVIEAMSLGLPVVVTDTCGLAAHVRAADAGAVVGPGAEELRVAVERLLADPELRARQGRNARAYVESSLSISAVAQRLEALYRT